MKLFTINKLWLSFCLIVEGTIKKGAFPIMFIGDKGDLLSPLLSLKPPVKVSPDMVLPLKNCKFMYAVVMGHV